MNAIYWSEKDTTFSMKDRSNWSVQNEDVR